MTNTWEEGWTCPECGMAREANGHDPCLGELPGVKFACCGHGGKGPCLPYIYFENGVHISWNQNSKLYIKRD